MEAVRTTEEAVEITFLRDIFDKEGNAINKKGETIRFLPLLLQSCMNPGNFTLFPVELRIEHQNGEEMVFVRSRYREGCYRAEDIKITMREYHPGIDKAGCNPCRNCGRC